MNRRMKYKKFFSTTLAFTACLTAFNTANAATCSDGTAKKVEMADVPEITLKGFAHERIRSGTVFSCVFVSAGTHPALPGGKVGVSECSDGSTTIYLTSYEIPGHAAATLSRTIGGIPFFKGNCVR